MLPKSLGGDLVEPMLCAECNGEKLSPLDQALAERSLVALARVAYTPKTAFAVKLGGDQFFKDDVSGLVFDVVLKNEMQPVLLPQVHLKQVVDEHTVVMSIGVADQASFERLDKVLKAWIEDGTLSATHVKIGPHHAGPTARFVAHRMGDAYVRAQSQEDAERLIEALQVGWNKASTEKRKAIQAGKGQRSVEKPWVQIDVEWKLDDANRAVAKIAMNTMAARIGSQFALSPEFDPLRAYILGEDIRHPPQLAPGEIAVDGRFVTRTDDAAVVPTGEHAVTLCYVAPTLYAWVTLYRDHNYVVRLGDIPLPGEVLATHEFSSVRSGNQALDLKEVFERVTQSKSR